MKPATLYIVATPLGNLGDISARATTILAAADMVFAEDTRHTTLLLQSLNINRSLVSLHDHNEAKRVDLVLDQLEAKKSVALVSDAGTPLISDPGYTLVKQVREAGFEVIPIPGPSAVIAALSVSGLPCDRFTFIGFLPRDSGPRKQALEALKLNDSTLIFYEAPHRIEAFLSDALLILGADRKVFLAREMTKTFEQYVLSTLGTLPLEIANGKVPLKGEWVLIIEGAKGNVAAELEQAKELVHALRDLAPHKTIVSIVAKSLKVSKNELYNQTLLPNNR